MEKLLFTMSVYLCKDLYQVLLIIIGNLTIHMPCQQAYSSIAKCTDSLLQKPLQQSKHIKPGSVVFIIYYNLSTTQQIFLIDLQGNHLLLCLGIKNCLGWAISDNIVLLKHCPQTESITMDLCQRSDQGHLVKSSLLDQT